jgi:hypothetical protein
VVWTNCSPVLKVKREKELIEERDEFDMMEGNRKTLAERLGTSPEDIEKKMRAKQKGTYITVGVVKSLVN